MRDEREGCMTVLGRGKEERKGVEGRGGEGKRGGEGEAV